MLRSMAVRSRGDDMLLRIPDIDEPRVVPGAAELMMDDAADTADWDGDPGVPIRPRPAVRRCIAWKT